MVTGASTADLAVLLVDARKGVLTQTRRHSYLAKLVGIRRFVLAVNKMDLVDYDQGAFDAICRRLSRLRGNIGIDEWVAIPVSGLNGDNVMSRSDAMPWYTGPSLLEHLDTVPLDALRTSTSRCGCRCNGSTGPTRTSAASPARSPRERWALAPRSASCPTARSPGSTGS